MVSRKIFYKKIFYNNKFVVFRVMPDGAGFIQARKRIDVCPLCKQQFTLENTTSVVLIISSQAGIPNHFIHTECLQGKTEEETFQLIVEDYQQALKYSDWFDYG